MNMKLLQPQTVMKIRLCYKKTIEKSLVSKLLTRILTDTQALKWLQKNLQAITVKVGLCITLLLVLGNLYL